MGHLCSRRVGNSRSGMAVEDEALHTSLPSRSWLMTTTSVALMDASRSFVEGTFLQSSTIRRKEEEKRGASFNFSAVSNPQKRCFKCAKIPGGTNDSKEV